MLPQGVASIFQMREEDVILWEGQLLLIWFDDEKPFIHNFPWLVGMLDDQVSEDLTQEPTASGMVYVPMYPGLALFRL